MGVPNRWLNPLNRMVLQFGPLVGVLIIGGYLVAGLNLTQPHAAAIDDLPVPDSWQMSGEEITDQIRAAHVAAGGTVVAHAPVIAPEAAPQRVQAEFTPAAPAAQPAVAQAPVPQAPVAQAAPAEPTTPPVAEAPVAAQPQQAAATEPAPAAETAAPAVAPVAAVPAAAPKARVQARKTEKTDKPRNEAAKRDPAKPVRTAAAPPQPKIIEPPTLRQLPPPPEVAQAPDFAPAPPVQPRRERGLLGKSWDVVTGTTGAVTDAAIAAPGAVWRTTRKTVDVVVDTTVDTAKAIIPGSRRSSND